MPRGGKCPPDHPRRCKALRHDRSQCERYALKDSNYCSFHGGRRADKHRVRIDHLPKFYSKRLGPTLTARLEELTGAAPSEQLSLLEELSLMRVLAGDTVALYDAAVGTEKTELVANAGMLLRDALRQVADMCEKAARVDALAKDKISIHHLSFVVNQIVRIAAEVFGDDTTRAAQFEQLIRERVRLPSIQQGTLLTPDADVVDMDSTIPKGEMS